MPKSFEKPKVVLLSSAILRDCLITSFIANTVTTNKTGKCKVILTSEQIGALTDPFDQRLLRMIDVRVSHIREGSEDKWVLSMVQFSPEMTFDTI